MKKILLGICLVSLSAITYADCRSVLVYGQYKKVCDSSTTEPSHTAGDQGTIEFTEVPPNATQPVTKQKAAPKKLASLEQSVEQAYKEQSHFKPTHTQLDQVHQLLEYAKSQGCTWGGKFDRPLLICPE